MTAGKLPAREALDLIEFLEARHALLPPAKEELTAEQQAAYQRLRTAPVVWDGKPMADRDEANAR